jgi:hypothetical protein
MDFGMFVPWVVATKSLAGWVQLSRWPAVSNGFCFDSPRHSASLLSRSATPNRTEHQRHLKRVIKSGCKEFSVLNGLEWIVLTAAVLGVFVVGDLVLCRCHASCRHFMGRR